MPQTTKKTVKMFKYDDKKHSIVYKPLADEKNPILTSVYLMRTYNERMPIVINVTVETETASGA